MSEEKQIIKLYEDFGEQIATNFKSDTCDDLLLQIVYRSHVWLYSKMVRDLTSKVAGKQYFWFYDTKRQTRGINKQLWISDPKQLTTLVSRVGRLATNPLTPQNLNRVLYTAAASFACVSDLDGDSRKRPGTFFEYLIRFVLSRFFNVNARTSLPINSPESDETEEVEVDLVFDLGDKRPKYTVPVKTSTRERIIQVWAHQRIIDGVFGMGRYRGLPVFMAETKTESKTGIVTEICTPLKIQLQNWYIARQWHVTYLDMPAPYAALAETDDDFQISTLGELLAKDGRLSKSLRFSKDKRTR